jgi:NADH-ubiquinone oxidoreductase chain 4L
MIQVSYFYIFGIVGGLFSILALSLQYKHLLRCLLRLEAITLTLFIFILGETRVGNSETYTVLVFITLAACEARLGLAILVSLIRTHGNDYVYNFSSQKC